jgi:hypothetical protein
MSNPPVLWLAPVTLSMLNPQTNKYQQVGRVGIVAARVKDSITIVLRPGNEQPAAGH